MADCEPSVHQFMDLTVPEYAYMFGSCRQTGIFSKGPDGKAS